MKPSIKKSFISLVVCGGAAIAAFISAKRDIL